MDFEAAVRDGKIKKNEAREKLPRIMEGLKDWGDPYSLAVDPPWIFPLKGYGLDSVGGKVGNGDRPDIVYGSSPIRGYDFFDGNRHGVHPAHDIFIRDSDRNSLDDRTGQPVPAVAMVDSPVKEGRFFSHGGRSPVAKRSRLRRRMGWEESNDRGEKTNLLGW